MAHGGKRTGAGRKPGVVSRAKRDLAEMAQEHAAASLDVLVSVSKDQQQPGSARVSAAVAILDRAYGKPFQAIHHAGHDGGTLASIDPGKMSLEALIELRGAMNEQTPDADES